MSFDLPPIEEQPRLALTLVEVLRARADTQGDRLAYSFLPERGQHQHLITYAWLDERARSIAAYLQSLLPKGERIVLFYPTGAEYLAGFMGCLYGGYVAVPLFPPRGDRRLFRVGHVVSDCGARVALTHSEAQPSIEECILGDSAFEGLHLIATDILESNLAKSWKQGNPRADRLALIQYTSGTSGDPRGVMISHGNLISNQEAIKAAFQTTAEDISLSWLPLYHDMGLLGCALHPLYQGFHGIVMPAIRFLRNPMNWLSAIAQFGATIAGSPNFAYERCVARTTPEQRARLDLSRWRVAFNGSEPIAADTLDRFTAAFRGCGFKPEAFFPCYGLAESTLMVSGGPAGELPHATQLYQTSYGETRRHRPLRHIASGKPTLSEVLIVDPNSFKPVPDGDFGEIWVRGASVSSGYWNQPDISDDIFGATLAEEPSDKTWLRTGDLGFMDKGFLHVTGRLKEVVVLNGVNYDPTIIEQVVSEAHPSIRLNGTVAFSIFEDASERLVVIVEPRDKVDLELLAEQVRNALAREMGLPLSEFAVLAHNGIPRTLNGKVQRYLARSHYINGRLKLLAPPFRHHVDLIQVDHPFSLADRFLSRPSLDVMLDLFQQTLGKVVRSDSNFFEEGGDSLSACRLCSNIFEVFHVRLSPAHFLSNATPLALTELVDTIPPLEDQLPPPTNLDRRLLPLTPGQEQFGKVLDKLNPQFNHGLLMLLQGTLLRKKLVQAIGVLNQRHDGLRHALHSHLTPWSQSFDGAGIELEIHKVENEKGARRIALSLRNNPPDIGSELIRLVLMEQSPQTHYLFLAGHKLIMDHHSINILLEDLLLLYRNLSCFDEEGPAALPDHLYTFLVEERHALSQKLWRRRDHFWRSYLAEDRCHHSGSLNHYRRGVARYTIEALQANGVRRTAQDEACTVYLLLLTAFCILMRRLFHHDVMCLGIEITGHGPRNYSRTIGPLNRYGVLRIELSGNPTFQQLLGRIRKAIAACWEHAHPLYPESPAVTGSSVALDGEFLLLGEPDQPANLEQLQVRYLERHFAVRQVPFSLAVDWRRRGDSFFVLHYNAASCDARSAFQYLSYFGSILRAITSWPEWRIDHLYLLPREDRLALTPPITHPSSPGSLPLERLYETMSLRRDQTALIQGDRSLSYGALQQKANTLQCLLSQQHLGPESVIGVYAESGIAWIQAVLAILNNGSMCISLDPRDPPDRTRQILDASQPALILCDEHLLQSRKLQEHNVLPIEGHEDVAPDSAPKHHPGDGAWLHVLPRFDKLCAALLSHGNLAFMLDRFQQVVHSNGQRIWCVFHKTGSVNALAELITALSLGDTVVIPEQAERDHFISLKVLLSRHQVTHISASNSLLPHREANDRWPDCVHQLVFSFEDGPVPEPGDGPRMDIVFGTIESSMCAASGSISKGQLLIKPFNGLGFYLLDKYLNPVPPGVVGQVYLAGDALARGYFQQPALTASGFLPSPFQENQRLLRTDYLAIMDSQRDLHLAGRQDGGFFKAGHLHLPEELSRCLRDHPDIADALVICREGQLLAAVQSNIRNFRHPKMLLRYLASRLPERMIPDQLFFRNTLNPDTCTPPPNLPQLFGDWKDHLPKAGRRPFEGIDAVHLLQPGLIDALPLSQNQVMWLFSDILSPRIGLAWQVLRLDVATPYHEAHMRKALHKVCDSWPGVRVTYLTSCLPLPLQLFAKRFEPELLFHYLDGEPSDTQQEQISDAISKLMTTNPTAPGSSLIRMHIFQTGTASFTVLAAAHRAILDRRGLKMLVSQWLVKYVDVENSSCDSREIDDYAALLARETMKAPEHESFWSHQSPFFEQDHLPLRHAERPGRGEDYCSALNASLPCELSNKLFHLAARTGFPLMVPLLTAWVRVLSYMSGSRQVITGLVFENAPPAEHDQVGPFENVLPLGLSLNHGSWFQLMKHVAQSVDKLASHRFTPLAQIARELGRLPFDTSFALGEDDLDPMLGSLTGLRVVGSEFHQVPNAALALHVSLQQDNALRTTFTFHTRKITEAFAQQVSRWFERALQQMCDFHNLPFMFQSLDPLENLLENLVYLPAPAIHGDDANLMVTRLLMRGPLYESRIAVAEGVCSLSRQKLSRQATRFALLISAMGVGPEDLVVVLTESSIEQVVAHLAILEIGAICVPLAPNDEDDLAQLLSHYRPRALLLGHDQSHMAGSILIPHIPLDLDLLADHKQQLFDPPTVRLDQGAYLLPTDHGRVLLTHRNLAHLVFEQSGATRISSKDSIAIILEPDELVPPRWIWPALCCGAPIRFTRAHLFRTPQRLQAWLIEQQITQAFCSSMVAAPLLRLNWPDKCPLNYLLTHGQPPLHYPSNVPFDTFYHYGKPSFGALSARAHHTPRPLSIHPPPLGRATRGTRVFLLDHHLMPVPPGAHGRIFVSGMGLARGFLDNARLTAQLFLPNPFSGDGDRLFDTRDEAFLTDNALLLPSSRATTVASMLCRHPSVSWAEPVEQSNNLVFRVRTLQPEPETKALMAFLRQRLPASLLPSAIIKENSTVDAVSSHRPIPPLEQLEELLCLLWSQTLGGETLDAGLNFFMAGGQSRHALQLIALIHSELNVSLPLGELYRFPTPQEMASHIKTLVGIHHWQPRTPIRRDLHRSRYPLSHNQYRTWLIERIEGPDTNNRLSFAWLFDQPIDPFFLELALTYLLMDQRGMRIYIEESEGMPFGTIGPIPRNPLTVVDLRNQSASAQLALLRQLSLTAIASTELVNFRFYLLIGDDNTFLLAGLLHRLIADEASLDTLLAKLKAYYHFALHKELRPRPHNLNFGDYALWERRTYSGEEQRSLLYFWRQRLESWLARPNLGKDQALSIPADTRAHRFPEPLVQKLRSLCMEHHVTMFMMFLALVKLRLSLDLKLDSIMVGRIHRDFVRADLSRLIGPLANTVILRTDCGNLPHFAELLRRVRRTTLESLHFALPYEKILEEPWAAPRAPLVHPPIVLQMDEDSGQEPIQPEFIRVRKMTIPTTRSRHQMVLTVKPQADALSLELVYNRDLIREEQAFEWLISLQDLAHQVSSDPFAEISSASTWLPPSLQPPEEPPRLLPAAHYVPPRGESEEKLAHLWMELLGCERVGAHDNFFQLGGHAWLASRLAWRARREYGVILPLIKIFDNPTLEEMADFMASTKEDHPYPSWDLPRSLALSPGQLRPWFLEMLDGGGGSHHQVTTLIIRNPIHLPALHWSLMAMTSSHDMLRIRVNTVDGEACPRFVHGDKPAFHIIDLTGLSKNVRRIEANRLVDVTSFMPFDLEEDSPWRVVLQVLAADHFILTLVLHEIAGDKASLDMLVKELIPLYEEKAAEGPVHLNESDLNYFHFSSLTERFLRSPKGKAALAYWQLKLKDTPKLLSLPTNMPRQEVQSFHVKHFSMPLAKADLDELQSLVRDHQASIFCGLLAVFKVMLLRYCHQSDLVVGTPTSGRNHPYAERAIGPFAGMLPIRTKVSGNHSFVVFLERVRESVLHANAHGEVPLGWILEHFVRDRGLNHNPLFQVTFSLKHSKPHEFERAHLNIHRMVMEQSRSRYDLSLEISNHGPQWESTFIYNSDLFHPSTIEQMALAFAQLLRGATARPEEGVGYLPLNQPDVSVPLDQISRQRTIPPRTVHGIFEDHAAHNPDKIALCFRRALGTTIRRWSYRDLNRRANRMASRLKRLGVGYESPVAVLLSSSPESLACLLAILKAGGCYVPLDPAWPPGRLAYMIEDCDAKLILTTPNLYRLLGNSSRETVYINEAALSTEDRDDLNIESSVVPGQLAYLLYTSGQGGPMMGNEITHAAISSVVRLLVYSLELSRDLIWLSATEPAQDPSILEWFVPLTRGGTLIMASSESAADGIQLSYLMEEHNVNVFHASPSTWERLRRAGWEGRKGLVALSGGEVLSSNLAQWLLHRSAILYNCYGTSETCARSVMGQVALAPGHSVHLGFPLPFRKIYVLDEHLQLVPRGVVGQIFIDDVAMARCYKGFPRETAESFLPDPLSRVPGSRMFRTGDLARKTSEGSLLFLGRLDDRLKIRGYRVEPGEIEIALTTYPGIHQAAVSAKHGKIMAYMVCSGEIEEGPLRAHLSAKIPNYMMPDHLIFLDQLPRTPSGHLNRDALPEPARVVKGSTFVPPRNWIEEELALIWSELLNITPIGVYDNFFELGGSSRIAVRLVWRVRQAFTVLLPLKVLFQFPQIAGLAERIRLGLDEHHFLPPILARPPEVFSPLSYSQQRLWFQHQLQGASAAHHYPFVLKLQGMLDIEALKVSIRTIIKRHAILRTTFTMRDDLPMQRVGDFSDVILPLHDITHLDPALRDDRAEEIITDKTRRGFDLESGPLLRLGLIQKDRNDFVLLMVLHMLVGDTWSMSIFTHELAAIYHELIGGKPCPLPPLKLQFTDFVHWQQGKAAHTYHLQLNYWRQQLQGLPERHALPTDHPRPTIQSHEGDRYEFTISQVVVTRLHDLGRRRGACLFMTLQTAFVILLGRMSNATDVVIGSPVTNRHYSEIEPLIGPFANRVVLRHNLSGDQPFEDLLRQTRLIDLQAFENQDVPFEEVVDALQPPRSLEHEPLFQNMFEFRNMPEASLSLPKLRITLDNPHPLATRYELSLVLIPQDGRLQCYFDYNTELYDEVTIDRLARYYSNLLLSISSEPQARISQLELHNKDELRRLLESWNRPIVQYQGPPNIFIDFENIVNRIPDQEALWLVPTGERWSYRRLYEAANHVATGLRTLVKQAEMPVAVFMEPSAEAVAMLLGVLSIGASLLPLDPSLPIHPLREILQRTQTKIVLGSRRYLDRSGLDPNSFSLLSPQDWQLTGHAYHHVDTKESLALLFPLSDHQGHFLISAISHEAIINFVHSTKSIARNQANHTVIAVPGPPESVLTDLLLPLLSGQNILLVPEEKAVTGYPIPPGSMPQARILSVSDRSLPMIKKTMPGHHLILWSKPPFPFSEETERDIDPHWDIWHFFGCPETCLWVAGRSLDHGDSLGINRHFHLVGNPLGKNRVYLLDPHGAPTPLGGLGRLCIGSSSLARGYYGNPRLTAQRFVPDPFSLQRGSRLFISEYKARYLFDGRLDLIPADRSVYRRQIDPIHAGDILTALYRHEEVVEAQISTEREGEQNLLVATVKTSDQVPLPAEELPNFLTAYLPKRYVPDRFRFAHTIIPNTPRDHNETELAQIWSEVLNLSGVGIYDNFFELGGHSLLVIRVNRYIRERLNVKLPMRIFFQTPTIAGLAARLADFGHRRREMEGIRHSQDNDHRLSFSQQRLWFLHLLEDGSAFHENVALRLFGAVDVPAMDRAINTLQQRHQILGARFRNIDGTPRQRFDAPPVNLRVVDLSGLGLHRAEQAIQAQAQSEATSHFSISRGPLWRIAFLRMDPWDSVLILTCHQIICDRGSLNILLRELAWCYLSYHRGDPLQLPDLDIGFADFATWQRQVASRADLENRLDFWRQHLSGCPDMHEIPTDRPRPTIPRSQGASEFIHFESDLLGDIEGMAHAQGVSLPITLEAIFAALLCRYSGQNEMAVGTTVNQRLRPELEHLVGPFANTVVLRNNLEGSPHFLELLGRLRLVAQNAFANDEVPFERVVEVLCSEHRPGQHPLFQIFFEYHNRPADLPGLPHLDVAPILVPNQSCRYDLSLIVTRDNQSLSIELAYRTDLFDTSTAVRMLAHLKTLTEAVCANPKMSLARIELLNEFERALVLEEWSRSPIILHGGPTLHHLIEAVVDRQPNAAATTDYQSLETYTYRKLDLFANKVAHALRQMGARCDTPIVVFLEPTPLLPAALLGVLKAGGCWVPLDPDWPSGRMDYITRSIKAPILLTNQTLLERLSRVRGRILEIETLTDTPGDRPSWLTTPSSTAYIMHTSGSTGKPKGAHVNHRALVNHLAGMHHQLTPNRETRLLSISNMTFDISIVELFLPLLAGGLLVTTNREVRAQASAISDAIRDHRINLLQATPTQWHRLRADNWQGNKDLTALSGGEPLPPEMARWLLARCKRLFNLYGPTETTIWSNIRQVDPQDTHPEAIGGPLPGYRFYILDDQFMPAAIGITGELCIGGIGVCGGYREQPRLTANSFLPDPFSQIQGARLYRSGDLGRYRLDGRIDFLGRLDDQIKIRGYRIEPGEIENALSLHPELERVVVLPVPGEDGRRLTAFIQPKSDMAPPENQIRTFLAHHLPQYMIPMYYRVVNQFPMTAHGKVDRRVLLDWSEAALPDEELNQVPRTPIEETLTAIWREVLKLSEPGVYENFFKLGGHSLHAAKVTARICDVFAIKISVRLIFERPTIRALADHLENLI